MDDLLGLDLVAVARLLRERAVSPVELSAAALARIEDRNPRHRAFVTVASDLATEGARRAEREIAAGEYRGPLHGIPVAVKDIIAVEGLPVTASSAVLENVVSDSDAPVVTRLRKGGAVLVGTTALDEFAFSTVGTGMVNPAAEDRSPGGSSGGSAVAVAAGMCFAALGTDTGGSVRVPASCCGIVGVKPSAGVISTEGVVPLAWSLDHVGVLTRSPRDAAAVLQVLEAWTRPPASRRGLRDVRIGVPGDEYLATALEAVRNALDEAVELLRSLGASVSPVELPDPDIGINLQYLTVLPEAAAYHFGKHSDRLDRYTEGVRAALEWGATVTARDYVDAQRVRAVAAIQVDAVFARVDAVALPTMPILPPPVGEDEVTLGDGRREDVVSAMLRYTALFNHTGHPALSVPARRGLEPPIGLQLVGPHGSEARLVQLAAIFSDAAG